MNLGVYAYFDYLWSAHQSFGKMKTSCTYNKLVSLLRVRWYIRWWQQSHVTIKWDSNQNVRQRLICENTNIITVNEEPKVYAENRPDTKDGFVQWKPHSWISSWTLHLKNRGLLHKATWSTLKEKKLLNEKQKITHLSLTSSIIPNCDGSLEGQIHRPHKGLTGDG